jgi:hypothetical protein
MKVTFRLPDEIVLQTLTLVPQRVVSPELARLSNGKVNRKPCIARGAITLPTKGLEVEMEFNFPNVDKGIHLVACMGPDGRWHYFDENGGPTTWYNATLEYLAAFGKDEQAPDADDALPDADSFLDQLTEDTNDQIVAEYTVQRRTGPVTQKHFLQQLAGSGGTIEMKARGTGHVINPADKK